MLLSSVRGGKYERPKFEELPPPVHQLAPLFTYAITDPQLLAAHVSHAGGEALSDPSRADEVPADLRALLEGGQAQWMDGLRVHARDCLGLPGL